MAYEKQTFIDNKTTLLSSHLNHIEEGIYNNDIRLSALENNAGTSNFEEKLMVVKKEGDKLTIRCKDWTDTEDFVWRFNGVGSTNKAANLQNANLIPKSTADESLKFDMYIPAGSIYKQTTDDTAPISFHGTYWAGNHAMTSSTLIKGPHNLTMEDIGSVWVDSDETNPHEYMLAKVDSSTNLRFINLVEQVISGNGAFNHAKHTPIAPLKHVRNATNTDNINFTSFANSEQLQPGSNHVINKYYVDDKEITEDGLYYGNKIYNVCTFDIIYVPSILEYLQNNVGKNTNLSYYSDDITEKYMSMEIIHEFRPNGSQTTYQKCKLEPRYDIKISYWYTAQVAAFGKPSYLYIPGAYNNTVFLHDGTSSFTFNGDTWVDENTPPYRYFTFNSEQNRAFQIAFSQDTHFGKPENRIKQLSSKNAGWSPGTCKLYPIFTANTHKAGSSFDAVTGRMPINKEKSNGLTSVAWYWEYDDIIMTIDSHEKIVEGTMIDLPKYMHNKKITVLDKTDSVVSYPPLRAGKSLHYATNQDYGHLVIRLHD